MSDEQQPVRRTVTAGELMTSPVITLSTLANVGEAANLMLVNRIGSVVVVDENDHFAGLITERMLLPSEVMVPFLRGRVFRVLGVEIGHFDNFEETLDAVKLLRLGDVMNEKARCVSPETPVADVVEQMVIGETHHVCVLDARKPVGIVSRHDLLRLFFGSVG